MQVWKRVGSCFWLSNPDSAAACRSSHGGPTGGGLRAEPTSCFEAVGGVWGVDGSSRTRSLEGARLLYLSLSDATITSNIHYRLAGWLVSLVDAVSSVHDILVDHV